FLYLLAIVLRGNWPSRRRSANMKLKSPTAAHSYSGPSVALFRDRLFAHELATKSNFTFKTIRITTCRTISTHTLLLDRVEAQKRRLSPRDTRNCSRSR